MRAREGLVSDLTPEERAYDKRQHKRMARARAKSKAKSFISEHGFPIGCIIVASVLLGLKIHNDRKAAAVVSGSLPW